MALPRIYIVAPCFNENTTVIKFLAELEYVLATIPREFTVIIVDDSSTDDTSVLLTGFNFSSNNLTLKVISLNYNQGHQAAIYQGLIYASSLKAERVIVMDSDGEDDPLAIKELADEKNNAFDIVNVVRGRRQEKVSFIIFYKIYKVIFYLITGKVLNFGNYCMISKKVLDTSIDVSFIHFAAHLSRQKVKSSKIVYDRKNRLDGKSKMKLNNLIHHAFKSFVEYSEELLMVFLKLFITIATIIAFLVAYIIYEKLFTSKAIPGWASTLSVSLIGIAIICLGFFVMGILLLNLVARQDIKTHDHAYTVIK